VFCEGGIVQEIAWPDDGKFDTTHSFQITSLKIRSFKFGSIKSRLRVSKDHSQRSQSEITVRLP